MSGPEPPGSPSPSEVLPQVRRRYAEVARSPRSCCGPECCVGEGQPNAARPSVRLGYTAEDLDSVPDGTDLGLGCGNPTGLLSLGPGETVLDLGSGAGVDCFLAARRVGPTGRVIGVDMTPEMIDRARAAAARGAYAQVEFRLGEIEHLPVADGSVGVVLSNCVINLAADKRAVYAEAFRALRPGGRLAVSDMVATRPIPEEARRDPARWSACSSGAISREEIRRLLREVGFVEVRVEPNGLSPEGPGLGEADSLGVVAMSIRARKPSA